MPLCDVQWVLGHAHLSTTQLYLTPAPAEVIAEVLAHHQRRLAAAATPPPPTGASAPAIARSPWTTLVPQALVVIVGHAARRPGRGAGRGRPVEGVRGRTCSSCIAGIRLGRLEPIVACHPPRRRPAPGPDAGAAVHREGGPGATAPRAGVGDRLARRSPWPDVAGTLAGQRRRRSGNADWWRPSLDRLQSGSMRRGSSVSVTSNLRVSLNLLVCADAIRPGLRLAADARSPPTTWRRTWPVSAIRKASPTCPPAAQASCGASSTMTKSALRRAATILAAKGGLVADITVGDCLELEELQGGAGMRRTNRGAGLYGVLHSMGVFGADAPFHLAGFRHPGPAQPAADAATATASNARLSGRCSTSTSSNAPRPSTTPRCAAWPSPSGGCSGVTWRSTIPGSAR